MNISHFAESHEPHQEKSNIESNELVNDLDVNNDSQILCTHCLRTKDNGIRCMGICVADSDY